jgi:hypothetical protein
MRIQGKGKTAKDNAGWSQEAGWAHYLWWAEGDAMPENYDELLLSKGNYCSLAILYQDGPIGKEVCEITLRLLDLAEKCWNPKSMKELGKQLPERAGVRTAAVVGSGFHDRMYDLAKRAQARCWLPAELKITRPVTRRSDPRITARGLNSAGGPDFVYRGTLGGVPVDAAWDLTTNNALARHYDRDVLEIRRDQQQRPDLGIQQIEDTQQYWNSYIAICY